MPLAPALLLALAGCGGDDVEPACAAPAASSAPAVGDANGDGYVDVSDAAWILRVVFAGGAAPACASAADLVAEGKIEPVDAFALLDHLFEGASVPTLADGACDGWSAPEETDTCGRLAYRIVAPARADGAEFGAQVWLDSPDLSPEAWSVSVRAEGCTVTEASTAGTIAALTTDVPPGLVRRGYTRAVTTTGGAASAAILDWRELGGPDPGDRPVLALRVRGTPGAPCTLRLEDGAQGAGEPVSNVVSVGGRRYAPVLDEVTVHVPG